MSAEGAPAPIVLDLPSDPRLLGVVHATLRGISEDRRLVRLEPRELDEVLVALHEACTNSIRHAHHGDPRLRLRVEFVTREDALEIRVEDTGAPFELDGRPTPAPEALEEGGYGIRIMRSWMDEVDVARRDDRNVLRMVRRYRRAAGVSGG